MKGLPPLPPGKKTKRKLTANAMEQQPRRKFTVMKEELWRLANEIVADDDVDDEKLIKISELVKTNSTSEFTVPLEFLCPISKDIIQDPVVLATGYTYDRSFIEKHLREGHRTCPQSGEELSDSRLIPNRLVKQQISNWCNRTGLRFSNQVQEVSEPRLGVSEPRLDYLIAKLPSCSLPDAKSAVKDLRDLSNRTENHALFGIRKEAIAIVLHLLLSRDIDGSDPDFHVDLVALVHSLSLIADIKKGMGEHATVIHFLTESLRCGPTEARATAAAALARLSTLDSDNKFILESGAIRALTELLQETEHPRAVRDVASALVQLCNHNDQLLERALNDGMHRILLQKMEDHLEFADELLAILALFSENWGSELRELGAGQLLLRIIRETANRSTKENAAGLLKEICDEHEFAEGLNALSAKSISKQCHAVKFCA